MRLSKIKCDNEKQKNNNINNKQIKRMVYLNARSVTCNLEKIELICSDLQPELIICTESRITEQIEENEYEIDGYNTVVCMSNSRHNGGVLFYIKKNLKYKIITNESIDKVIWCVQFYMPLRY